MSNRWDEALNAYDKAIELNPNDAPAYNNRGLAYDNLDKNDLAIADYKKAIELNPKYGAAFNNLGKTLRELWQLPKSNIELRQSH